MYSPGNCFFSTKYKLGTGWQESIEIDNIRVWEDIEELNDKL